MANRADVTFNPWLANTSPKRPYSLWMEQAVDSPDDVARRPTLQGTQTADVCIVGGGFTGLWTALRLLEAEPSMKVVIVEADLCGSGASGRNNGGVGHLWTALPKLVDRLGPADGLRLVHQNLKATDDIKAAVETYGIECELHRRASAWCATAPDQVGVWRPVLELAERLGVPAPYVEISEDETRQLFGKGPYYAAAIQQDQAWRIQPAKLARGLLAAVEGLGCIVHERSPVLTIEGRDHDVVVSTASGSVQADHVVMAANAWMAHLPEFKPSIMVVTSGIVATDPIPELLEKRGLAGRPGGFNAGIRINAGGLTQEGRVQVGGAGHSLGFRGRVPLSFDRHQGDLRTIELDYRYLYPELDDVAITHSWSGAIDRSEAGLPRFGHLAADDRVHYAIGYTGHGVTATSEAGHILTSAILGRDDEWGDLRALYNRTHTRGFPPEPVRSAAAVFIGASLGRAEQRVRDGKRPWALDRRLSRLATASTPLVGARRSAGDGTS
ncbi:MAG TPA: FAD-binding oxidoreductase [Marmoricola sp.]|jgi:glycine/D-amino acid oxidase-like deaminating enzyme|nr:FAD-binding oxidoreductase [Marmoricola sp.]